MITFRVCLFLAFFLFLTTLHGCRGQGNDLLFLDDIPLGDYHVPMMTPTFSTSPPVELFKACNIYGHNMCRRILNALLYRPPVGAVACIMGIRLVLSGRLIAELVDSNGEEEEEDKQTYSTSAKHMKRKYRGRGSQLDKDDTEYLRLGICVEKVRRKLCEVALKNPSSNECTQLELAILDAFRVISDPRSSDTRVELMEKLIPPLSRLEAQLAETPLPDLDSALTPLRRIQRTATRPQPSSACSRKRILTIATLSIRIQAMDLLLRIGRNRLLKAAARLAREEAHWNRRVLASRKRQWWNILLAQSPRNDNPSERLMYARAAFQSEVTRLGQLTTVLLQRPSDMEEAYLLKARKDSMQNVLVKKANERWWKERRRITPESAAAAIAEAHPDNTWLQEATDWIHQARRVLFDTVTQTVDNSKASQQCEPLLKSTKNLSTREFSDAGSGWLERQSGNVDDRISQWGRILRYVDSLSVLCRIGESRKASVKLQENARRWLLFAKHRLDIGGIPSYFLQIWVANFLHHILLPHLPHVRTKGLEFVHATASIVRDRAWVPLKGIVDDIMNRSEGMMSAFSLQDEEFVLDNMLKAAGFGDGTSNTRATAVKQATEQYEQDYIGAFYVTVASGRLVRLLLIQCQQLKVGMLSALQTIDVLMKGNRIHFQILAGIPAVWMFTYGTRIFFRALYSIRAKDIRPVRAIHGDMTLYLEKMESLFLRSSKSVSSRGVSSRDSTRLLTDQQLGELLVLMHRYLVLLDYGTPLFPSRECDQIHLSLQELLSASWRKSDQRLHSNPSWELQALALTRGKHEHLGKHL